VAAVVGERLAGVDSSTSTITAIAWSSTLLVCVLFGLLAMLRRKLAALHRSSRVNAARVAELEFECGALCDFDKDFSEAAQLD
jgi:hypothetical protein